MVIVRCSEHSPPKEIKRHYVHSIKPFGYPATAVICGRKGCKNPGLIWLEALELEQFNKGETVFEVGTNRVRVRAEELKR